MPDLTTCPDCTPPTGSGGWRLCGVGLALLATYYQAIDGRPGERAAWWPAWTDYLIHIGQAVEVTA